MFLNRAMRVFPITPNRRMPLDQIEAKIRALADEMFGSVEPPPPS